jgi:hypothetical protein
MEGYIAESISRGRRGPIGMSASTESIVKNIASKNTQGNILMLSDTNRRYLPTPVTHPSTRCHVIMLRGNPLKVLVKLLEYSCYRIPYTSLDISLFLVCQL